MNYQLTTLEGELYRTQYNDVSVERLELEPSLPTVGTRRPPPRLLPEELIEEEDTRTTDCIGRPQRVYHGESQEDKYKQHYYIMGVNHMEHRIGRISAVRRGQPVLSWTDYSDERFGLELMDHLGEMDIDSPKYKSILENYKRDRIKEIKRWMEEEEILKSELKEEGLLREESSDERMQGSSNKEALFNLRTPTNEFSDEDRDLVRRYDPENFFPTEGIYTVIKSEMKLLDVNPETADRIYFDIPRKPEAYASENKKHPEVWGPKGIKERVGINQEHLQMMKDIITNCKFGIIAKAFWEIFAEKVNINSFNKIPTILGNRQPNAFFEEASDIFYCPKEMNPFKLIYPASLKDIMPAPEDIFALIWHQIRTILGDRKARPNGRLPIDSISSELKRIYDIDVEPSNFGFPDWKELCLYFIRQFGSQHNIAVFDIIFGDQSYLAPELAILKESNLEYFEGEKAIARSTYAKYHKQIIAVQTGTANRINKLMSMEEKHKYMQRPEDIVRIPLRRGTRLRCFVDNVNAKYPLFLAVVPTALSDIWMQLNAKVTNFYVYQEGDNAKVDLHPDIDLVIGLHVIVYYRFVNAHVSKPTLYHRGRILNRKSAQRVLRVELYDRNRIVDVTYDNVRLMTPEIFYFAPALSIGLRIHVDAEKYPRAVEWDFMHQEFFKFTEEEIESLAAPVFMMGDLYVDLVEEFPSRYSVFHFWSAVAKHESREMKSPFAVTEEVNPSDLINVKALISKDKDIGIRFVHSYNNYVAYCEENNIPPLKQKLGNPILDPGEVKDMTEMKLTDIFRYIDHFYIAEDALSLELGNIEIVEEEQNIDKVE